MKSEEQIKKKIEELDSHLDILKKYGAESGKAGIMEKINILNWVLDKELAF